MGKPDIVMTAVLPKLIYGFNIIPIKIPTGFFFFFFLEIEKVILKCMWECEGPRSVRTIWEKKVGGLTPPDFKT